MFFTLSLEDFSWWIHPLFVVSSVLLISLMTTLTDCHFRFIQLREDYKSAKLASRLGSLVDKL
jgi:hypothetical protein